MCEKIAYVIKKKSGAEARLIVVGKSARLT